MRSFVLFALLTLLPVLTNAQSTDALQAFEKAVAESRDGNHAGALSGFETTLAIIERDHSSDAFFSKVHYNAGVSLYHLDRTFESAIHLEKALSYTKGRHAKAYYLLGLIGLESNDLKLAERALRSAVALDNRNGEAWYDLSRVYVALDEPVKAKRAYDRAVKNGAEIIRTAQDRSMAALTAYE
ncbi:MAG: tetratricopeptide repeat protein [Pyrinomonadaceae bacterium]